MLIALYEECESNAEEPTQWAELLCCGVRIDGKPFEAFRVCRDFSRMYEWAASGQWKPDGVAIASSCPYNWRAEYLVGTTWLPLPAGARYEVRREKTSEWEVIPREDVVKLLVSEMYATCHSLPLAPPKLP